MLVRAFIVCLALGCVALLSRPPGGGRLALASFAPSSTPIRLLARSHLSLVADLAWIRMASLATSIKYPQDGKALLSWGHFITDLDPRFLWAYAMGGLLAPVRLGSETYNGPEAVALLDRGTRALPGEFRLYLYLAATHLDATGDVAAAAAALRRGGLMPGAPEYLAPLAARLLAQSGQFEAAREFALELSRSDDPVTRQTFQRRLLELDREQAAVDLEAAIRAFEATRGRLPAQVGELVGAGLLLQVPADPLGGDFLVLADGGVATTSGDRLRAYRPRDP